MNSTVGKVLVMLSIISGSIMYGQHGVFSYQISPEDAIIYIDSIRLNETIGQLQLSPGEHVFKAWAPTRKLVDSLVIIKADVPSRIIMTLALTDEYRDYLRVDKQRKSRNFYRKIVKNSYYIVPAVYAVTVSIPSRLTLRNDVSEIEDIRAEYEALDLLYVEKRKALAENYNLKVDEYDNKRKTQNTLDLSMVGVSALLFLVTRHIELEKEPAPYQEKTLLSRLEYSPILMENNKLGFHLSFKL